MPQIRRDVRSVDRRPVDSPTPPGEGGAERCRPVTTGAARASFRTDGERSLPAATKPETSRDVTIPLDNHGIPRRARVISVVAGGREADLLGALLAIAGAVVIVAAAAKRLS